MDDIWGHPPINISLEGIVYAKSSYRKRSGFGARIEETLRKAENAGINTFFGRTDDHILGIVEDYWNEGGQIQWIAQVSIEHNKDIALFERYVDQI